MLKSTIRGSGVRRRQAGLSIVEMLVGLAVGLFIVGGTVKLFVDYLVSSRDVLQETRVNQDLRAAADLVIRDLRRAGYWADAISGVVSAGATSAPQNPFTTVSVPSDGVLDNSTGQLTYTYDQTATSAESAGFRARNGVLEMLNGAGGWQAVTDASTLYVDVARLEPTPIERGVDLYETCPCLTKLTCTKGQFQDPDPDTGAKGIHYDNRPRLIVRQYALRLAGYAPAASAIRREIRETVRLRNDRTLGVCP